MLTKLRDKKNRGKRATRRNGIRYGISCHGIKKNCIIGGFLVRWSFVFVPFTPRLDDIVFTAWWNETEPILVSKSNEYKNSNKDFICWMQTHFTMIHSRAYFFSRSFCNVCKPSVDRYIKYGHQIRRKQWQTIIMMETKKLIRGF